MGDAQPLVQALRKLAEENLGNLTPHPLYSGFYHSHPTLLDGSTRCEAVDSRGLKSTSKSGHLTLVERK